jgi:heme/copper-type cytochrome/quinol oxidase subunit 2
VSSFPAANDSPAIERAQGPDASHRAGERADHRLTLILFTGIVALAIVGTTVSIVANSVMRGGRAAAPMMGTSAIASTNAGSPQRVSLSVVPGLKPGPKGEKYDAFSKTNFAVKVGKPLQLTIDNKDDVVHSITATSAGVSVVVMPGLHTYTIVVHQAGHFKWICAYPCDPYSMSTVGYMQGYITAT